MADALELLGGLRREINAIDCTHWSTLAGHLILGYRDHDRWRVRRPADSTSDSACDHGRPDEHEAAILNILNRFSARRVRTGVNRYALAAGTAALSILLAACSSSSKSNAPTTAAPAVSTAASSAGSGTEAATSGIVISGFAYSGTMTVKPGQKVTVTNQDSVAHTVTDKNTHLFDTGNIAGNGGTGTFTAPTKPGSYPFGCTYHPNMHGTLIVQG